MGSPLILKLAGSLMVILATSLLGHEIATAYARRPQQLRLLRTALQMLETEVAYARSLLPEALGMVAARLGGREAGSEPVAKLFRYCRDELRRGEGLTGGEAWIRAVEKVFAQSALKPRDREILLAFGAYLGASDKEDQIKHLRLAQTQLAQEEAAAWEERRKNSRLYHYLGVSAGLIVVLTLL
ncbi:MAG: stage III sporulation protein SpoIIIAB [Firmicutes bacterium]|nr:stage III sporulation protein SpoIIIAB [Bacillota bacterium]